MNENRTHTINYLAYLCFILDLKKQELESYKIASFHENVISFLKIFNDFGYLDQEDEQGYTFNDYLFIFPSLTFISLLEKSTILNYKFNKATNKVFEQFLDNGMLSIYIDNKDNLYKKEKETSDKRISKHLENALLSHQLTNSFSDNMVNELISVHDNIQSIYDENIMKKDIIPSKKPKKEDLRKF